MYSIRNRIKRLNTVDYVLIALVLTAILLTYLLILFPGQTSENQLIPTNLFKDFIRTIYYLNKTTTYMNRSIQGLEPKADLRIRDVDELINKLESTVSNLEALKRASGGTLSSLGEKLYRSAKAYRDIAYSIKYTLASVNETKEAYYEIKHILDLLNRCEIDRAIQEYEKIKPLLEQLRKNISMTYNKLLKVNENALWTEDHKLARKRALHVLEKAYNMVDQFIKLMEYAKKHSEALKEMCRFLHGQQSQLSNNTINSLKEIVGSIDKEKLSKNPVGTQINELLTTIQSAIEASKQQKHQKGNGAIGQQESGEQKTPGSGAGYREVTEDD